MTANFEISGLLTARAAMGRSYSIEIQRSGGCRLSLPHRRWHVVSFYPRAVRVLRRGASTPTDTWQAVGHTAVYPAGTGEEISWHRRCDAMHLHLDPQSIRNEFGEVRQPQRRDPILDKALSKTAAALFEEARAYGKSGRSKIAALVSTITSLLARDGRPAQRSAPSLIGKRSLNEILDLMHGPDAARMSVSELSEFAGISDAYFSRRFRALFGCAPHDYLITSRVELAKHAVFNGAASLKEIALETGFYDQAHLANAFRERAGLSITDYRTHFDR